MAGTNYVDQASLRLSETLPSASQRCHSSTVNFGGTESGSIKIAQHWLQRRTPLPQSSVSPCSCPGCSCPGVRAAADPPDVPAFAHPWPFRMLSWFERAYPPSICFPWEDVCSDLSYPLSVCLFSLGRCLFRSVAHLEHLVILIYVHFPQIDRHCEYFPCSVSCFLVGLI